MNYLFCLVFLISVQLHASGDEDGCSDNLENCYQRGKEMLNDINKTKDMDKKAYLKKKASSRFKLGCENGHSKSCQEYKRLKKLKKLID